MLIRPHDAGTTAEALEFARDQGFGHLVSTGRDRTLPVVVPTQFLVSSADLVELHLARDNPIWQAIAENARILLSVAGDWIYIPSWWKAIGDEDPTLGVPTTYYAAVQICGTAQVVDEEDDIWELLRRQLDTLEPGSAASRSRPQPSLLAAVRGLQLHVDQVLSKFKYGSNLDDAHRGAVLDRLIARAEPGDHVAAARVARTGRHDA